jgi:outer membrane protein
MTLVAGLIFSASSYASNDLMNVYLVALQNDPTFKAAHGTYFANKELSPQALSVLLPQVSVGNSLARNTNSGDTNQVSVSGDQSYDINTFTLSATQQVFNYQNWMQLKQANDTVKGAEATYNAAAQNLITRVATAYLAVLQAKDNLRFTRAQKRALEQQMNQAKQRYDVGLDTMTSVYQAQAQYDLMAAQEIADRNSLFIAFENLRTLTNKSYNSVAPLRRETVPLVKPTPTDPQVWVDKALSQNYSLLSAKYTMNAARENIKAQQAGHYPTADVSFDYNDVSSDASQSAVLEGQNNTVALNLTLPLYQGGLISSQTRQAEYQFETAAAQFQSSYLNTLVSTKTAYNTLLINISKIKADRQSVSSSENSVKSTTAQYQVGTLTMVDVLTAQQQLYSAQTQQATDQYAYMNAILALKQAAGTLGIADLETLNSWLDKDPKHAVINDEQIS